MNIFRTLRTIFKNEDEDGIKYFIAFCKSCNKPVTSNQGYMVRGEESVATYTHIDCGMQSRNVEKTIPYQKHGSVKEKELNG